MIKFFVDVDKYNELVFLLNDMNIKYNVTPPVTNYKVKITIIDIDLEKLFLFMCVLNNQNINLSTI